MFYALTLQTESTILIHKSFVEQCFRSLSLEAHHQSEMFSKYIVGAANSTFSLFTQHSYSIINLIVSALLADRH
jgi:hypothetical protein